jgi:hypothetical protein
MGGKRNQSRGGAYPLSLKATDFIERVKANVQIPNLAEEIGKGASKYFTVQLIEMVIFVKHVLVMSFAWKGGGDPQLAVLCSRGSNFKCLAVDPKLTR